MRPRWWLVLVVLILVPTNASAQIPEFSEPAVELDSYTFDAPIMPETEAGVVELSAQVGCNEGDTLWGSLGRPTVVTWDVENAFHESVSATLSEMFQSKVFDPQACLDESHRETFTTNLNILMTRRAPAFVGRELTINLWVEKPYLQDSTTKYGPFAATVLFAADYVPILEYDTSHYVQKVGPGGEATFPVKATNFGNGVTRIITTVRATKPAHDLLVIPPPLTTLNSFADGTKTLTSRELLLWVRAPNESGLYVLEATFEAASLMPAPPHGANLKDTQSLTLSVQVTGGGPLGADSPGPGIWMGLLGLGLVAGALKRSRKS